MTEDGAILFFDGYCTLCSGVVQFILPRDHQGYFKLGPLHGETAKQWLRAHPLPDQPDSLLLWEDQQWHVKSAAALRVTRHLPGWRWAWSLRFIPRGIRDLIYVLVARSRYSIFGKNDACYLPRPEWADRFVP